MAQIQTSTERRFDLFAPPANTDLQSYVWTAALLVGLLVIGVPLAAALTSISVWNLILAAGAVYLGVLLATRTEFVGLESALVVLMTFDMGFMVLNVPQVWYTSLLARPVDLVAFVLLGVFAYRRRLWRPSLDSVWRTLAVVAFFAFVCWSFLAAAFGTGPSTTGAGIFAVEQLRYAVVLVLAAAIAEEAGAWAVLYPLVIALGGNLAVALAEVANGGVFGLYSLGETFLNLHYGPFALGPKTLRTGLYAGGFLGHGREFTIALLMFVPVVIAVAAHDIRWRAIPAGVAIAAAVLVIRVADTDAGWASLFIVLGLVVAFGLYLLADRIGTPARIAFAAGTLVVVLVGGYVVVEVLLGVRATGWSAIPFFQTRSLDPRLSQYAAVLDIAGTHPLFGLGGLNFFLVAADHGVNPNGVHNTFFSHLAATGFVGLGLYLVSILSLFLVALRRTIDSTTENRFLWACLVCAMIGFHAYSSWDLAFSWETASMVFWALAGVVIGTKTDQWEWATASA